MAAFPSLIVYISATQLIQLYSSTPVSSTAQRRLFEYLYSLDSSRVEIVSPSEGTKLRFLFESEPNTGDTIETVVPSTPSLCHVHQIWALWIKSINAVWERIISLLLFPSACTLTLFHPLSNVPIGALAHWYVSSYQSSIIRLSVSSGATLSRDVRDDSTSTPVTFPFAKLIVRILSVRAFPPLLTIVTSFPSLFLVTVIFAWWSWPQIIKSTPLVACAAINVWLSKLKLSALPSPLCTATITISAFSLFLTTSTHLSISFARIPSLFSNEEKDKLG